MAARPSRSCAFYRRWFALGEVANGDGITFMSGGRDFLFALMDDPAPAPMPAWFHFGIRLDTAAEIRATLAAMAYRCADRQAAARRCETLVSFRCADPDGYPIEVYWPPERHHWALRAAPRSVPRFIWGS